MWRMTLTVLASGWLFAAPMLWAHRPEQAVLSMLVGVAGLVLSPLITVPSRLRLAMAITGGLLTLGIFAFPDSLPTSLNNLVLSLVLITTGLLPEVRRTMVRARVEARPVHRAAA